jgi:hypothetical protein
MRFVVPWRKPPENPRAPATHADLHSLKDFLMGLLDDKIKAAADAQAATNAALGAAVARVQGDLATLHQQIADFQGQVASGAPTQAQSDSLDAIKATADSMTATLSTLDAAIPAPAANPPTS